MLVCRVLVFGVQGVYHCTLTVIQLYTHSFLYMLLVHYHPTNPPPNSMVTFSLVRYLGAAESTQKRRSGLPLSTLHAMGTLTGCLVQATIPKALLSKDATPNPYGETLGGQGLTGWHQILTHQLPQLLVCMHYNCMHPPHYQVVKVRDRGKFNNIVSAVLRYLMCEHVSLHPSC